MPATNEPISNTSQAEPSNAQAYSFISSSLDYVQAWSI